MKSKADGPDGDSGSLFRVILRGREYVVDHVTGEELLAAKKDPSKKDRVVSFTQGVAGRSFRVWTTPGAIVAIIEALDNGVAP